MVEERPFMLMAPKVNRLRAGFSPGFCVRLILHRSPGVWSPMGMEPNQRQSQPNEPMLIILFRSKLTDQAGEDYQAMNAEMESLVRPEPRIH
jgi:hypothetical protein